LLVNSSNDEKQYYIDHLFVLLNLSSYLDFLERIKIWFIIQNLKGKVFYLPDSGFSSILKSLEHDVLFKDQIEVIAIQTTSIQKSTLQAVMINKLLDDDDQIKKMAIENLKAILPYCEKQEWPVFWQAFKSLTGKRQTNPICTRPNN